MFKTARRRNPTPKRPRNAKRKTIPKLPLLSQTKRKRIRRAKSRNRKIRRIIRQFPHPKSRKREEDEREGERGRERERRDEEEGGGVGEDVGGAWGMWGEEGGDCFFVEGGEGSDSFVEEGGFFFFFFFVVVLLLFFLFSLFSFLFCPSQLITPDWAFKFDYPNAWKRRS